MIQHELTHKTLDLLIFPAFKKPTIHLSILLGSQMTLSTIYHVIQLPLSWLQSLLRH